MYAMIKAFRQFSPNARSKLTHGSKTSILWIVLLQARRFTLGKMAGHDACLAEFSEMVRDIMAKNCANISHVEVPTELLHPTVKRNRGLDTSVESSGRAPTDPGEPEQKKQKGSMEHPYSTELAEFFKGSLRDAGNPKLGAIAIYCGITKEQLLPDFAKQDCRQFLVMGTCLFGKGCKFHHRTANKTQIETIKDKFKRFKTDPLGMKGEKK